MSDQNLWLVCHLTKKQKAKILGIFLRVIQSSKARGHDLEMRAFNNRRSSEK